VGWHLLLGQVGVCCAAHSRDNEDIHSLLKSNIGRCRHIGIPLVSERCRIKKKLKVGSRGCLHKWSVLERSAADLLDDCLNNIEEGEAICAEEGRYAPAPSSRHLSSGKQFHAETFEVLPELRPTPVMQWATPLNLMLHREVPRVSARKAIYFGKHDTASLMEDDLLFMVMDKAYSLSWLWVCRVLTVYDKGELVATLCKIELPFRFLSSLEEISSYHGRPGFSVHVCKLEWSFSPTHGLHAKVSHVDDTPPSVGCLQLAFKLESVPPVVKSVKPVKLVTFKGDEDHDHSEHSDSEDKHRIEMLESMMAAVDDEDGSDETAIANAASQLLDDFDPDLQEALCIELLSGSCEGASKRPSSTTLATERRLVAEALASRRDLKIVDAMMSPKAAATYKQRLKQIEKDISEKCARSGGDAEEQMDEACLDLAAFGPGDDGDCREDDGGDGGDGGDDDGDEGDDDEMGIDRPADAIEEAPPHPVAPMSKELADTVYAEWRSEFSISLGILKERAVALGGGPLHVPLGGLGPDLCEISLMSRPDRFDSGMALAQQACELVAWVSLEQKLGRVCKLDASQQVKYPMGNKTGGGVNVQDFPNAIVVHPAAGIAVSNRERPRLPFNALRLKQMWHIGCSLTIDAENKLSNTAAKCHVCSLDGSTSGDIILKCPLCLLPWHMSCLHSFSLVAGK
jgi:hypothetical protein